MNIISMSYYNQIQTENLIHRIELSGGNDEYGYLFKHLVITEDEYNFYKKYLDILYETLDIDFISVEKNGILNFYHVTDISNKTSIIDNGLLLNFKDNSWIPDLGQGIYVINSLMGIGYDNLIDYLTELDLEEFLLVEGKYSGTYLECIYGDNHKGYILLKNDIGFDSITNMEHRHLYDL